jgi:hypothetical protein
VGPISKTMALLPRPAREAVARFLKADQILVQVDDARRAAYEDRAKQSEPGSLEPVVGDEPERERQPVA